MKICECSQCGVSAASLAWGWVLLARDGWGLAQATNPPGAAERAWLCAECEARAGNVARRLGRPASTPQRVRADRPLKVLLVDDQVLVLRTMARLLSAYETTSTSDPNQALALLEGGATFDVVLSDVMMPKLTGPELYARCYRHSPQLARHFLFASADPVAASRLIAEAAAQVGADRVPPLLAKPASRAALLSAVSSVALGAAHDSGTYELRPPDECGEAVQHLASADRKR